MQKLSDALYDQPPAQAEMKTKQALSLGTSLSEALGQMNAENGHGVGQGEGYVPAHEAWVQAAVAWETWLWGLREPECPSPLRIPPALMPGGCLASTPSIAHPYNRFYQPHNVDSVIIYSLSNFMHLSQL